MKLYYNFHIHTCLSPCCEEDMTPGNIVLMCKLCGFDAIAVTDHNSCRNCRAAVKAGEQQGLVVIPGMELTTSEDIHVICLFPDVQRAEGFDRLVTEGFPKYFPPDNIFGRQLIVDENDSIAGNVDYLLLTASSIGVNQVKGIADSFGGFCFPAHVDRNGYGILSVLGAIPPEAGFTAVELSGAFDERTGQDVLARIAGFGVLHNSDAHSLYTIGEPVHALDIAGDGPLSAPDIIAVLKALRLNYTATKG